MGEDIGDRDLKQVKLLAVLMGKALRRRLPCLDSISWKDSVSLRHKTQGGLGSMANSQSVS